MLPHRFELVPAQQVHFGRVLAQPKAHMPFPAWWDHRATAQQCSQAVAPLAAHPKSSQRSRQRRAGAGLIPLCASTQFTKEEHQEALSS